MGNADVSISSPTPISLTSGMRPLVTCMLLGIVLCMAENVSAQDGMTQRERMAVCVQQAASTLPDVARSALDQIAGTPRQLLALRSYLRARDLEHGWSWTEVQIGEYQDSPEQLQAQVALARVQERFSDLNPGYTLYVNTKVRSLDTQLARWNTNTSVGVAASALENDARATCKADASGFAQWLKQWRPPVPANLAAPGLSSHGQARAFDFQVKQGDQTIAGTDSRTIDSVWTDDGWAGRLAQAIKQAGPPFEGPLRSPREPWHYAFDPDRVLQQDKPDENAPGKDTSGQSPTGESVEDVHGNDCG